MDCYYCQDMKLFYKNETNTMRVITLKIKFQNSVFSEIPFLQLCYSMESLLTRTQDSLQNRNASAGDERESISAWVLPVWFLLVAGFGWLVVFLKLLSPGLYLLCCTTIWSYSGYRIVLYSFCNGNKVLRLTGQMTYLNEERYGKGCFS